MGLELVVAVAENGVIGRGNQLPWRLSADLRHFKALTLGKPVLMGRKTYESIGKALPGRLNIVLSRSPEFAPSDCVVAQSLDDARIAADGATLMVIGPTWVMVTTTGQDVVVHVPVPTFTVVGLPAPTW